MSFLSPNISLFEKNKRKGRVQGALENEWDWYGKFFEQGIITPFDCKFRLTWDIQ